MPNILYEDQILVPAGIEDLESFRRWTYQDDFPESGRIDYIGGNIEIDISPEQLFAHGRLKTEFVTVFGSLIEKSDWLIVSDQTRIASVPGDLSAEPDVVLLSRQAIQTRRVILTPKANRPNDYIEIEGPPELVVEVVSDSSVQKDLKRLPPAYFAAGIDEYWIADARGDDLRFVIHHRGSASFEAAAVDDGWQTSSVLNTEFRLTRPVVEPDWVEFELQTR